MRHKLTTALAATCLTSLLLPYGALAQAADRPVLRFADIGGIRSWQPADDGDALLIEGRNRQWYRATFWGTCPEIKFSTTIGFVTTEPTGDLDRFSSIIAEGRQCHFRTFEEAAPPGQGRQSRQSRVEATPRPTEPVPGGSNQDDTGE